MKSVLILQAINTIRTKFLIGLLLNIRRYGYAELIDLYVTGNYYADITIEEYKKTKKNESH